MPSSRKVAVLVGSLRRDSLNRKVARALAGVAPAGLGLEIVDIGALALYNEDLDGPSAPQAWTDFRAHIRAADAVLFVTPEYNRSVPGALKNAIDVGSRPSGKSVWEGKPGAIVSVLALGGQSALTDLPDDETAARFVNDCMDAGITYLDTAPMYGRTDDPRNSERRIGFRPCEELPAWVFAYLRLSPIVSRLTRI